MHSERRQQCEREIRNVQMFPFATFPLKMRRNSFWEKGSTSEQKGFFHSRLSHGPRANVQSNGGNHELILHFSMAPLYFRD